MQFVYKEDTAATAEISQDKQSKIKMLEQLLKKIRWCWDHFLNWVTQLETESFRQVFVNLPRRLPFTPPDKKPYMVVLIDISSFTNPLVKLPVIEMYTHDAPADIHICIWPPPICSDTNVYTSMAHTHTSIPNKGNIVLLSNEASNIWWWLRSRSFVA